MAALDDTAEDDGPISSINIIPFVDIVLVLLVIFMLTSATIIRASLKVELPKAASASEAVTSVAAVTIAKGGKMYFNQEPVDEAGLIKKYKESYAGNNDINLIVSADKDVTHGTVVHAIDLAKLEGITKFAINVESVE
jgi:biopolymer transport protein ExbD